MLEWSSTWMVSVSIIIFLQPYCKWPSFNEIVLNDMILGDDGCKKDLFDYDSLFDNGVGI